MERDDVLFPDADEIAQHALAFARMMFAHAAYEREFGALQDAITGEQGFGERRKNQWHSEDRPKKIAKLIAKHRANDLPQVELIKNILSEAVGLCRQRNFLAHGTWWRFDPQTSVITVRGGTRWGASELPPDHHDYAASDIEAVAEKFKNIGAELFKLRRSFEPQKTEAEIRAEILREHSNDEAHR